MALAAAMAAVLAAVGPASAAPFVYTTGGRAVSQYDAGGAALVPLSAPLVPFSPPLLGDQGPARDIAVSADGRSVYVTAHDMDWPGFDGLVQYSVGRDGRLTPKVPFRVPAEYPDQLAVSPDSRSVYVTNDFTWIHGGGEGHDECERPSRYLSRYPVGASGELLPRRLSRAFTGQCLLGVAVSPEGEHVYATGSRYSVLQYSVRARRTLSLERRVSAGQYPGRIAVSPDGRNVYVTGLSFLSQYSVGRRGRLLRKRPFRVRVGRSKGLAVSPDGRSVYVQGDDGLHQYSIGSRGRLVRKSPAVVWPAGLGTGGSGDVAITPDGRRVYVTGTGLAQFSVGAGGALAPLAPVLTGALDGVAVSPLPKVGSRLRFSTVRDASCGRVALRGWRVTPARLAGGPRPLTGHVVFSLRKGRWRASSRVKVTSSQRPVWRHLRGGRYRLTGVYTGDAYRKRSKPAARWLIVNPCRHS